MNKDKKDGYYVSDHLGSTRAVVDDQGTVLETFDYYPFGLLMPKRNTAGANTIEKFTGKERDEEGGLNLDYFGARYYDAALGRWLGIDPLAKEYPEWSPYNYTLGNPINLIDPDGRMVVDPPSKYVNQVKYSLRMAFGPLVETAQNFITAVETSTEVSVEAGAGSPNAGSGFKLSYRRSSKRDENGNEISSSQSLDVARTFSLGVFSNEESVITGESSSSVEINGKKGGIAVETSNGELYSGEVKANFGPFSVGAGTDRNNDYVISAGGKKDFDFGAFYGKIKATFKAFFNNPKEKIKQDLKKYE